MNVIINSRTGESSHISAWVSKFTELWQGGQTNVKEFMDLLGDDVKLIAPGIRSTTGRKEGLDAFKKTFELFPDLKASVQRWSASENILFVEMTFTATIGNRPIKWYNVDRFIFKDGLAVERVAFYNPARIRREYLRSPSGWLLLFKKFRSRL